MKKVVLLITICIHALYADFDYSVENTNFTISQDAGTFNADKRYLYNYDRLRFRADYIQDEFFATIIADGVNYFGHEYMNSLEFEYIKRIESDTPFKTQSGFHNYDNGSAYAKLYRLYGGYEDDKNRVTIGLQNISMGVGRIWTPTNLFNPKNIYALEPDETFGVAALSYTRHLSDTSHITAVVSQNREKKFRFAGSYKSFYEFVDLGLNAVKSDDTTMLGFDLESNLYETGVEIRAEGAYIKNSLNATTIATEEKEFFQGIIGADYGFENGITLLTEALYSSETFLYQDLLLSYDSEIAPNLVYSNFYTALSLSYSFNIFLDGSFLYIESFNDKNSRFISPTLTYTLNDYNSFMLGAMFYSGDKGSEFGELENSYYFKWSLAF